jgi:vesicle coat complex subunit
LWYPQFENLDFILQNVGRRKVKRFRWRKTKRFPWRNVQKISMEKSEKVSTEKCEKDFDGEMWKRFRWRNVKKISMEKYEKKISMEKCAKISMESGLPSTVADI